MSQNNNKRLHGQFFTTSNPFVNEPFVRWMKSIPKNSILLEPFAGANNIIWMIQDLGYQNKWACYDIDPDHDQNSVPEFEIIQKDTIKQFPKGFEVVITNPPYLAKNSATKRGLDYAGGEFDDVYKKSLQVMLENTEYVAAIIPESFITQNLFHERLSAVVSLPCRMFDDTEVPVCLALFVPDNKKTLKADFEIWSSNRLIGTYQKLKRFLCISTHKFDWKINDPAGLIGLNGIDNKAKGGSIAFVPGSTINASVVKSTSRSITRISLEGLSEKDAERVVKEANSILKKHRENTKDVFLTAFKGLRGDGKYRRRLDFAMAKNILDLAYASIKDIQ